MKVPIWVRTARTSGHRAILDVSLFGGVRYTTASYPDRTYVHLDEATRPRSIDQHIELDATPLPSPSQQIMASEPPLDGWIAAGRAAAARLEALWLLTEDRHRLLDVEPVEPLAHQASLVAHVLSSPSLRRVLIADEVGLGKTIEAGLIVKRLMAQQSSARVLYLTEAGLVSNVVEELRRLGMDPRRWTARYDEARIDGAAVDPLVVASVHRAVHKAHFDRVASSGPWDIVVLDEAHHLTDWSPDGGDPQRRMRLARELVNRRLRPDGRVLILTGTPHQGHLNRFKNLLDLLRAPGESEAQAAGRVIYRIKDDILDWDGRPLFPRRDVRKPTSVAVDVGYREWMEEIRRLLSGQGDSPAGAWRRAQALQWGASSPEAGLGYLARMALRAGMQPSRHPALKDAVAALRPYRGGAVDESVASLAQRMAKVEIDEDEEELLDEDLAPIVDTPEFERVLRVGANLVQNDAFGRKLAALRAWLEEAHDEKFVVFAQPVETVWVLKRRLEAALGAGSVSMIVGGLSEDERRDQIELFRHNSQVRVLVSSRSGGEGINLQISRRLVHFDVPWNPMDMEQRVGRVHRYGSSETIIVETLVVEGSREQHMLERSRARLGRIAKDLGGSDRIETLFGRVMSLIPMQDLEGIMSAHGFGPFDPVMEERLNQLVTAGFEQWRTSHEQFVRQSARLQALQRGVVTESDLADFLITRLEVRVEAGWKSRVLGAGDDGAVVARDIPTAVLALPDGRRVVVERGAGVGYKSPAGSAAAVVRVGLNDKWIAEQVRSLLGGDDPSRGGQRGWVAGVGAFELDQERWREITDRPASLVRGAWLMVHLVRCIEGLEEVAVEIHALLIDDEGRHSDLPAGRLASFVRTLRTTSPRRGGPPKSPPPDLISIEDRRVDELRRGAGLVRRAVFPVATLRIDVRS